MSNLEFTSRPSGRLAAARLKRLVYFDCWLGIGLLAALFVIVPSHLAFAQNTARVDGVVHDQSGAVVPNAFVVLRNQAQGTEFRAKTDVTGTYSIDLVPAATYTLIVRVEGFKTHIRSGLIVHLDDRLNIPVSLELGQQVQTIEVTAQGGQLVTTDSGAKTDVIAASQIQNLSTLGRNAVELLSLLPGVVSSFNPLNGSSFGTGVDAFNVNGLRNDMNDVRLDNAHMIDPGCNCGNIIEPNMDMIQEFSLKTSNFEADQGRSAMIMDTVMKSGGSKVHGEAYYYGRNAFLNANDWSNNLAGIPRPSSKFNYPGFNIGGPVRLPHSDFNKNNDKMFFFVGMEWQRQLPDPGTQLATIPSARMRTGDFSELLSVTGADGKLLCTPVTDSQGNVTGYNGRALNMPCQLTDPASGWGNTPLVSEMLPQNEISQNGKIFLNTFPLPNYRDPHGRYNFAGRPLLPLNRNEQTVRFDYNINDSTRMYIRLARNADHQFYPFGLWSGENSGWTSNIPEPSPTIGINHGQAIAINLVKIISPTLTNEFQFNSQGLWLPNHYQDPKKLSKSALGFNFAGMVFQNSSVPAFANGVKYTGDFIPQITDAWDYFGGNPGAGRWGEGDVGNRIFANKTEFEWLDNLTKVRGTHTMKFGVSIDRTRNDQNGGPVPEGLLITNNWGGYSTGNEFGDILTENYRAFQQGVPNIDGLWRFWNVEWYAQDSWKATRRLTLYYGARFSWMQPWNESRGLAETFQPRAYDPSQPTNFLNGLITAKTGGLPHSVFPNPKPVPQARLGFAYDLFGTGRTVLRGGYGMYVTRDQGNVSFFMANAPPFSFSSTVQATGGTPTLSLASIQRSNPFGALGNIGLQVEDRHDPNQPQTYEWSFTLSQNIGLKTILETSYVGNVSRHLYRQFDLNAVRPGGMFIPGTRACCANGDTSADDFRYFKPFAGINWSTHSDSANYNSLQVTAKRNVSNGLTVLASYTWSRTLGYTTSFQGVVDPFDSRRNYGLAPYDRAQILNFSYIYQLPKPAARHNWNRVAKGALDSWQISGITHYTSGAPLTTSITNIACTPGPGAVSGANGVCSNNFFGPGQVFSGGSIGWFGTPDIALTQLVNWQGGGSKAVGGHWVSPNSITLPPIGQFGTFETPTFRGPGSYNWDLTLFKSFPLGEQRRLELRLAAFDFLNHANLANPNLSASYNWVVPAGATSYAQGKPVLTNADSFGIVPNAFGHREVEFALKFYF